MGCCDTSLIRTLMMDRFRMDVLEIFGAFWGHLEATLGPYWDILEQPERWASVTILAALSLQPSIAILEPALGILGSPRVL